ncbi:hypothetical protein LMG24235_08230 [Paraburkholderia sabiae]|nr:hypothetical protein LMG24235_08230 [Paraburkholderia sabiae]
MPWNWRWMREYPAAGSPEMRCMAVTVPCGCGSSRAHNHSCWRLRRANHCGGKARLRAPDKIAQALPPQAWRRLSAGIGAKGKRLYSWALTPLWRLQLSAEERRFGHYLLVRRSLDETREHAFFFVYAPRTRFTRQTLVNVAGRRWEIEVRFEAAKGECGLDQYEVRRWQGRCRHITLALPAHAVLAGLRAQAKKTPEGSMPFSVQEIRRLLRRLIWRTLHSIEHVVSWSIWRRRHRYRAQQCHYPRRGDVHPAHLRL